MTRFVRTIQDALLASADARPDHEALVTGDRRVTYAELRRDALAFATVLIDSGLERGDRVAVYSENGWHAIVAILGTMLADGVFFVVNPQTKADKLGYILRDSGARFLVARGPLREDVLECLSTAPELRRVLTTGTDDADATRTRADVASFDALLASATPAAPPRRSLSADLASLVYTSGSTGTPKGVMMTHRSMVFITESLVEYLRLDGDHRLLGMLPLAFDYGLYQLFMAMRVGATLVLERNFTYPAELIRRIETEQVTVFPGVPTVYAMLLGLHQKSPLQFPSVLRVTNTAAALPETFLPALREVFPNALIYAMYGLTECKRVTYLEPELLAHKPGSVGKAIPGTEVFLRSPDGTPVATNEPGILHVRGEHVMLGYWKQPERTARMLTHGSLPFDRVLDTTDWFRMDDDGFLYFLGRSDEIIKTKGEKVSPIEVENALLAIGGVREAAVIGVADPVLGQAIHAFVAVDEGVALTEQTIRRACRARLEDFMVPTKVTILPELPKTDSGKIRRQSLIDDPPGP